MKERRERILDVAIALAEEGGFENVRQRDVAAQAGVALGTLYKSFRSKQDILAAALARQTRYMEQRLDKSPADGETPQERLGSLFATMTRAMTRKPKFTRAVLRAVASGVPEIAGNVTAYNGRMTGLIIAAMRGVGRLSFSDALTDEPTEQESTRAWLLQNIWFSSLVGWSAGLHGHGQVVEQMRTATSLLFAPESGEA